MRFPFFLNAGLLFGPIENNADWQQAIKDQSEIAQQPTQEAEQCLLQGLRRGGAWGDCPSFGNTKSFKGETLGEWAAAEEAARK